MLVWVSPAYNLQRRCLNSCCARLGTSNVQYSDRMPLSRSLLSSPKIILWFELTADFRKALMDPFKMSMMTRPEALSVEGASYKSQFAVLYPYPRIQSIGLRRCGH